ncbi:nucleoporin protein Ndc1-Nup-domain-containing protein [Zopfochytrium polystomum]|nr:nucleoporin protein Ndc1-Nup-domain-containing protein [Zopfochytrium polystomum]
MLGRPASSSFPAFGMAGSAALGAGGGGGGGGVGVGSVRGGGGGGIGGSHTTTALAALRTKQQQASAAALDASSARRILSPFAAGATAVGLAPARYDCMTSRVTRVQLQSIVPTIFITVLLSTPWSFSLSLSRAAWLLTLSLVTCIPLVPISFFKGRVTTVSRRPRSLTATISDFFRADQMLLVASYSFSALATFLVRANLSKSTGAWSSMFLKPQGRYGPTQLNETFVFTFFAAVLLGPLYAIGLHAAERHSLSFPSLQRRWRQRYFSSVSMFISWSFRYALFFAAAYWLCYGVFGGLIFFVVSAGFQPFTGVTLQRLAQFTIFDWRIVSHVFLEALHIVVFWESFSSIFECILTEPAPQNPLDSRVSDAIMGIQAAKQPYAQALAMLDILLIAKKDAQARKEMFNDPSELEMSPWTLAAATCLDHVDKVSERLEFLNGLREKELAKTRSSIPFGAPPLSLRVSPHKVALKEEQIMNPPKKSFMDSIFSVLSEPEVNPDPTAQKLYEKKRPEPKKTIPTLLQRPPAPSSNVFETPSPPASAPTPKVVRSTGEMVQEEAIAAATWTLKTAQWLGSKFLLCRTSFVKRLARILMELCTMMYLRCSTACLGVLWR